jgi:hypothetical protein
MAEVGLTKANAIAGDLFFSIENFAALNLNQIKSSWTFLLTSFFYFLLVYLKRSYFGSQKIFIDVDCISIRERNSIINLASHKNNLVNSIASSFEGFVARFCKVIDSYVVFHLNKLLKLLKSFVLIQIINEIIELKEPYLLIFDILKCRMRYNMKRVCINFRSN